jgi:hypothetical protein
VRRDISISIIIIIITVIIIFIFIFIIIIIIIIIIITIITITIITSAVPHWSAPELLYRRSLPSCLLLAPGSVKLSCDVALGALSLLLL